MSTYGIILLASFSIPFIVGFHPRFSYHKKWIYLFPAIVLAAIPYIIWDVIFTENSVWGFNDLHISGIELFGLPIEEILFFVIIPYSSVFIYHCLKPLFKKQQFLIPPKYIGWVLILLLGGLATLYSTRIYTLVNAIFAILIIGVQLQLKRAYLGTYLLSFLIILIPFIIVNGLLTGSYLQEEVVWYNANEIIGLRVFTIPVEDFIYAFSHLLLVITFFEEIPKLKIFYKAAY